MATDVGLLLVSITVILAGCELFTNGIEWLGHKLGLSEGATGSVLAAVGTAMPETMIPILALIFGRTTEIGEEIGIGAILGAPFMLSTLAMFVGGISIVTFSLAGRRERRLQLDNETIELDLKFFLAVFILAFIAAFIPMRPIKWLIAIALVGAYIYYLKIILSGEGDGVTPQPKRLYLSKFSTHSNPNLPLVALQVAISLGLIIGGARIFVRAVEAISLAAGVSTAVLSFLIAPVATELPEKANSVLWYSRRQDTLAMGNITGAMVFQSSIVVALGIVMTRWVLEPIELGSVLLALFSASLMFIYLKTMKHLHAYLLLLGGPFYLAYVLYYLMIR